MTTFRTACALLAAFAMALSALIASPRPAGACSCRATPFSEYADDVAVAFTGRQVQRIEPRGSVVSTADDTFLVLEVERVFKGRAGPFITVVTAYGGPTCGIDFRGRGLVAVAAFMWDEELRVGLCSSLHTVDVFEETFGPGYPPDETMDLVEQFGHLVELLGPRLPKSNVTGPQTEPPAPPDSNPMPNRTSPAVFLLIGAAVIVILGGAALAYRLRADNRAGRGAAGADHTTGEQ